MTINLMPSAVFERLKEHLAVQANIPGAPCEIMITHTGYLLDHHRDKKVLNEGSISKPLMSWLSILMIG